MEKDFDAILTSLLEMCEKNPNTDIDQLIAEKLNEFGVTDECINDIKKSNEVIDQIDANAESLQIAKNEGKTRGDWMYEKVNESLAPLPDDKAKIVIEALEKASNERTDELFNQ